MDTQHMEGPAHSRRRTDQNGDFCTTHWSVVLQAGQASSPESAAAVGFDELKVFLVERRGTVSVTVVSERLGITVPALRSVLHRLRESYRKAFSQEIAHTVASPDEIEDEVRICSPP
jgi:hypothetical protein